MKNNDGKIARLQAEYQQLNSQLQNKIQEHRDSEKELRKVKPEWNLTKGVYRFISIFNYKP